MPSRSESGFQRGAELGDLAEPARDLPVDEVGHEPGRTHHHREPDVVPTRAPPIGTTDVNPMRKKVSRLERSGSRRDGSAGALEDIRAV